MLTDAIWTEPPPDGYYIGGANGGFDIIKVTEDDGSRYQNLYRSGQTEAGPSFSYQTYLYDEFDDFTSVTSGTGVSWTGGGLKPGSTTTWTFTDSMGISREWQQVGAGVEGTYTLTDSGYRTHTEQGATNGISFGPFSSTQSHTSTQSGTFDLELPRPTMVVNIPAEADLGTARGQNLRGMGFIGNDSQGIGDPAGSAGNGGGLPGGGDRQGFGPQGGGLPGGGGGSGNSDDDITLTGGPVAISVDAPANVPILTDDQLEAGGLIKEIPKLYEYTWRDEFRRIDAELAELAKTSRFIDFGRRVGIGARKLWDGEVDLTDPKVWDELDQLIAGIADGLTDGDTTRIRESIYGPEIRKQHNTPLFRQGQQIGLELMEMLEKADACGLSGPLGFFLRLLQGRRGIKYIRDGVEKWNMGDRQGAMQDFMKAGDLIWRLFGPCFAAGTPLLTPDGHKLIEEFRPGDWVLSAPEDDPHGEVRPRQVEAVFVRQAQLWHLHVGGQVIRTTAEHPFYVHGKGWRATATLEVGDLLRSHDGQWKPVEDLSETGEYATVYNLRVAEDHTYFVGADDWRFSVWAHNNNDCVFHGTDEESGKDIHENGLDKDKWRESAKDFGGVDDKGLSLTDDAETAKKWAEERARERLGDPNRGIVLVAPKDQLPLAKPRQGEWCDPGEFFIRPKDFKKVGPGVLVPLIEPKE